MQVISIDPALGIVTLNTGGKSVAIGFENNSHSKAGPVGAAAAPLPSIPSTQLIENGWPDRLLSRR